MDSIVIGKSLVLNRAEEMFKLRVELVEEGASENKLAEVLVGRVVEDGVMDEGKGSSASRNEFKSSMVCCNAEDCLVKVSRGLVLAIFVFITFNENTCTICAITKNQYKISILI